MLALRHYLQEFVISIGCAAESGVGAAEGCDLLILGDFDIAEDQKIAAFGSSYKGPRRLAE
ncbi:hypothetical protein BK663_03990 [Pseudomonas lini]|uniref:Uncharacterized protein n=1 Tax=Pseudomonas lini TaxID=163011 RepID=A0A423IYI1_9PSED|nr:hypothetical protein BK663_03990 [Pseudomonas lini]